MYNYLKAIKEDIKAYIDDYISLDDYAGDRTRLENDLNSQCWQDDYITGVCNVTGYTHNDSIAEGYLKENEALVKEVFEDMGIDTNDSFSPAYIDSMIRCHLVSQAIREILREMFVA